MIQISLHLSLSLSLFVIFSSCNDKKIAFNNPSWELLRFHDCHYADLIFHYYVLILKFRSVFAEWLQFAIYVRRDLWENYSQVEWQMIKDLKSPFAPHSSSINM